MHDDCTGFEQLPEGAREAPIAGREHNCLATMATCEQQQGPGHTDQGPPASSLSRSDELVTQLRSYCCQQIQNPHAPRHTWKVPSFSFVLDKHPASGATLPRNIAAANATHAGLNARRRTLLTRPETTHVVTPCGLTSQRTSTTTATKHGFFYGGQQLGRELPGRPGEALLRRAPSDPWVALIWCLHLAAAKCGAMCRRCALGLCWSHNAHPCPLLACVSAPYGARLVCHHHLRCADRQRDSCGFGSKHRPDARSTRIVGRRPPSVRQVLCEPDIELRRGLHKGCVEQGE